MAPGRGSSQLEPLEVDASSTAHARFTLDEEEEHVGIEETALLAQPQSGGTAAASGSSDGKCRHLHRAVSRFTLDTEEVSDGWVEYKHEAGRIVGLAWPLTVSQFFAFALSLVALLFVGRLGEEELAIAVLATSFMNVTGFSLVLGLLGALDTLCGQAWGAKNYRALGVHLQKAILTTAATAACVALLWAHVEGLMLAVGQQPHVASGASRFLLLCIPALVCSGVFECLKRYLMAQGVVKPVTAVSCMAVVLSPLINWALIFKAGWGLDGAAYAMDATWLSMAAMLAAYVGWHERRRRGTPLQTWHGWSTQCLRGLGHYYRLAVPSTLMVCLEWWAYKAAPDAVPEAAPDAVPEAAPAPQPAPLTVRSLPADVVAKVASFMDFPEKARMAAACRDFRAASANAEFWSTTWGMEADVGDAGLVSFVAWASRRRAGESLCRVARARLTFRVSSLASSRRAGAALTHIGAASGGALERLHLTVRCAGEVASDEGWPEDPVFWDPVSWATTLGGVRDLEFCVANAHDGVWTSGLASLTNLETVRFMESNGVGLDLPSSVRAVHMHRDDGNSSVHTPVFLENLERLPNLRVLNVGAVFSPHLNWGAMVALEELSLETCYMDDDAFAGVRRMPNLRVLHVQNNMTHRVPRLSLFPALEELGVNAEHVDAVVASRHPTLKTLVVLYSWQEMTEYPDLTHVTRLPALKSLWLFVPRMPARYTPCTPPPPLNVHVVVGHSCRRPPN